MSSNFLSSLFTTAFALLPGIARARKDAVVRPYDWLYLHTVAESIFQLMVVSR